MLRKEKLPALLTTEVTSLRRALINTGNHLPNICTPLNDYSSFVGMYRKNARKAKTKEERIAAADAALTALPDGEVKSYILSQRSEVIDMLLTEYDEKKVMECLKQEARDEGLAEGLAKGKAEGLAEGEAKGLAKGEANGKTNTIIDLIKSSIITLEQGASQLGISTSQMSKMLSVR